MNRPHIMAATAFLTLTTACATLAFATGNRRAPSLKTVRSVVGVPAVVVELFTSEGCSDCPPADILLADLASHPSVLGAHVIGLEEHVTYFNGKSWSDPFSNATVTKRQYDYMQALRTTEVYTPQMIVDGHAEFVGSDRTRAKTEVRQSARMPQVKVNLTATAGAADGTIDVEVALGSPLAGAGAESEVFVALTQDGLSSDVRGGENRGRHLPHTSVVRSLTPFVAPEANGGGTLRTTLKVLTGASLASYRVVAFVQKANLGRIIGAADVSLAGLSE